MAKFKTPSRKRIAYLIKDEKKANREYNSYGYKSLANDEKRHEKFLIALRRK